MLSPPIAHERLDLPAHESLDIPSPKRQKVEETSYVLDYDSDKEEYGTEEYMERYNKEIERTGVYEIDFSKLPYWFGRIPLDLNDSTLVEEPETNRDYASSLANHALTLKAEQGINLKLKDIKKVSYHLCAGYAFYISFEAVDDDNQTIPYHALVRDFGGEITVHSCNPKPSST